MKEAASYPPATQDAADWRVLSESDLFYIFCFRPPLAVVDVKAYAVAVRKGFKTVHVNSAIMNKEVFTVLLFNKSITLF